MYVFLDVDGVLNTEADWARIEQPIKKLSIIDIDIVLDNDNKWRKG